MLLGSTIKDNLRCDLRWRDKLTSAENKGGPGSLHLIFSVILTIMTN